MKINNNFLFSPKLKHMDQTDILIQKTKKKHTKAVNFFAYFSVLALLVLEITFPVAWKENEIFPLWYVSIFLFSNEFALIAALCHLWGDNEQGKKEARMILWVSSFVLGFLIILLLRFYFHLI